RIEWTVVVISEITTGHHSEGADSCERARLRAAQGVLATAVANDLALASARQIQIPREGLTWIVVALTLGPALIVARTARVRLSRVARAATELARGVVAMSIAIVRQPQVVIAIEIVRSVVV